MPHFQKLTIRLNHTLTAWLVLAGLMIFQAAQVNAQENDPFAKIKEDAVNITKKMQHQIKIIDENLQYIEIYDHGRLIFLRQTIKDILDLINKGDFFKIKDEQLVSVLRKFSFARAAIIGLEKEPNDPTSKESLGFSPDVCRDEFKKLYSLAEEWAAIKGLSVKPSEPTYTFDLLVLCEQSLEKLHETFFSAQLTALDERDKLDKLAGNLKDIISDIRLVKARAQKEGDKIPVVTELAVPIIYNIQRVGQEMVKIAPLRQGEDGNTLFVMLGAVGNFVDQKQLEVYLQQHDLKVRPIEKKK